MERNRVGPASWPVIFAVAAILTGCDSSASHPRAATEPLHDSRTPVPVQTVTIHSQAWPDAYEAAGTVRARNTTVLSSKVMAYVREVAVQVGDRVREGQALVKLESQDLDVNVRRAEAAQAEVKKCHTRNGKRDRRRKGQSQPGREHVSPHGRSGFEKVDFRPGIRRGVSTSEGSAGHL
jgi:multidrug efflux pump subunit AcrA (membrane-fusion protein)